MAAPNESVTSAELAADIDGDSDHVAARERRRRRDRHGRHKGLPVLPPSLPGFRTRSELFDQMVMDAVVEAGQHWPEAVATIEFAVDDVPLIRADDEGDTSDVVDNGVTLTRYVPAGVDRRGQTTKPRIVVYRRPLEARSDPAGLSRFIADVLGEQMRAVFGDP